jgi:hypothetical protein
MNDRILVHFPRRLLLDLATNIIGVAQKLELDVVIHLALEFSIRWHRTVGVWAIPHPHPQVPQAPGLRLCVTVLTCMVLGVHVPGTST